MVRLVVQDNQLLVQSFHATFELPAETLPFGTIEITKDILIVPGLIFALYMRFIYHADRDISWVRCLTGMVVPPSLK